MSGRLNTGDIDEILKNSDFPLLVTHLLKEKHLSKRQLSEYVGRGKSYIQQQANNNNPDVALLLLLSRYLQTNMFQTFINMLPEHLGVTSREKELQEKIDELQKQVDALTKEKDLLMQIVLKK